MYVLQLTDELDTQSLARSWVVIRVEMMMNFCLLVTAIAIWLSGMIDDVQLFKDFQVSAQ